MTLSEAAVVLIAHALENPPALVKERLRVFEACKIAAPADSELSVRATTLVLQLTEHEKLLASVQQELPLIIPKERKQ